MSSQYGELRPTDGWDRLTSLGHPCKFQLVSSLGSVTARHLVVGVSQTLRRWTEGATYIRQGDHHVGHWTTFLVLYSPYKSAFRHLATIHRYYIHTDKQPTAQAKLILQLAKMTLCINPEAQDYHVYARDQGYLDLLCVLSPYVLDTSDVRWKSVPLIREVFRPSYHPSNTGSLYLKIRPRS